MTLSQAGSPEEWTWEQQTGERPVKGLSAQTLPLPPFSLGKAWRGAGEKGAGGHRRTVLGTRDDEDSRAGFDRRKSQQPVSPVTGCQLPYHHTAASVRPQNDNQGAADAGGRGAQRPPSRPTSPLPVKTESPKPLTPTTLTTHTHTHAHTHIHTLACPGIPPECQLKHRVNNMPTGGAS